MLYNLLMTNTDSNTRHGVCRNCGDEVVSHFNGRWASDKHGDVCFKAENDKLGPESATVRNRLHAVDPVAEAAR